MQINKGSKGQKVTKTGFK